MKISKYITKFALAILGTFLGGMSAYVLTHFSCMLYNHFVSAENKLDSLIVFLLIGLITVPFGIMMGGTILPILFSKRKRIKTELEDSLDSVPLPEI